MTGSIGQALHLGPVAVAGDAGRAGVDHVADAGDGERRLGHVGGQHDAPAAVRLEDPVLLGRRQPGVERQQLRVAQGAGGQGVGGVADLPLAAEEDQDVARTLGQSSSTASQMAWTWSRSSSPSSPSSSSARVARPGPVADLDRVGAAGHLDDRCVAEVVGEAFGVDGGRRDDHLQVGPPGQQLVEVAEQEVDVEAALVGLVDDERVVGGEQPVALDLGQQDAVGHHLDEGPSPTRSVKRTV